MFGEIFYKLKNNPNILLSDTVNNSAYKDLFLNIINKHNQDKDFIDKRNSIKNSIIYKIRRIISSPSNQLLANEPITIKPLHDGADYAKKQLGFTENPLSS
jgi:hypothetical protein